MSDSVRVGPRPGAIPAPQHQHGADDIHGHHAHQAGRPHTHIAERGQVARAQQQLTQALDALDRSTPLRGGAIERATRGAETSTAAFGHVGGASATSARGPATSSGDFGTRFAAAESLAQTNATREQAIASFLDIANDESLTPSERAQAFVAAGRLAYELDTDNTRAELFYIRALGLDADADANVPGARTLHLRILGFQGRTVEMSPIIEAELAANQPVTDDNRNTVMALHRAQASILSSQGDFQGALRSIDAAIQTLIDGGATPTDAAVLRLRFTRADLLQNYGAQRREADSNDTGRDDSHGRRLQRESLAEQRAIYNHLSTHRGDYDADTYDSLIWSAHAAVAERLTPRFRGDRRIPHGTISRAHIQAIERKFSEAETLFNRAVGRPPAERAQAEAELRQVRQLAEDILAIDPDDGLAHIMWSNARNAEATLGEPLITPIDTPEERRQVLDHLRSLADRANITDPAGAAPQPRTGQGHAALRQLFPQWDQLSETQQAVVAYQILGYGELIPLVIEQGAQYHIVGVGTSGAAVDPGTLPTERNQQDRAYYVIRGWAYDTGNGHFIQTGVEDILTGGRGGYPTFTHEFGHLVHQVFDNAGQEVRRLQRAGRPIPPDLQRLASYGQRIQTEFQRVRADQPRAIYYAVEEALHANPPRAVTPQAQRVHDDYLAAYQRNNGGASPPAQPSPPLNRFFNSYSSRNPAEYFAESAMNLMIGGSEDRARSLFSRNPAMWDFARELRDQYGSYPAGYDPQNNFPRAGLDAVGNPTTLHRLRRHAQSPHVGRAARPPLEQLQRLHNPPHATGVPPLVQSQIRTVGDPATVTHPVARQLIREVHGGDFAAAQATAARLQEAVQQDDLDVAQLRDATTALTEALSRAEAAAEWTAWDTFLTILLTLLTGIGGGLYALVQHVGRSDARALEAALDQVPLAQRDQGSWTAAGMAYAQQGGEGLADFRAARGRDALRAELQAQLQGAGFSSDEAAQRADWMLAGIDAADRSGQSAAPNPHYDTAYLSAAERQARERALLQHAGALGSIDNNAQHPNFLGDRVVVSGSPPTPAWDFAGSDAAIGAMSYPGLQAQVQLELAEITRQLAEPGLAPARRLELEAARAELQTLQSDMRADERAFFGDPRATPPVAPSRPPEELGATLTARRASLVQAHRAVLGPAVAP